MRAIQAGHTPAAANDRKLNKRPANYTATNRALTDATQLRLLGLWFQRVMAFLSARPAYHVGWLWLVVTGPVQSDETHRVAA